MRVAVAVDVAGCNFRILQGSIGQLQKFAVVVAGGNVPDTPAFFLIQNKNLTAILAVHLEKTRHDFHQAVKLRRKHVLIFIDADVNGLSAASERQEHFSRLQVAGHGDGVRSFKIIHGQAEGFLQIFS